MATEPNSSGARRRRNKKKPRQQNSGINGSASTQSSTTTTSSSLSKEHKNTTDPKDEKMHKNPLFVITVIILLPYALYNGYLSLLLQHPQYISFMYPSIRPAVKLNDTRQTLIVGTISSGTSQVAKDLKTKLGLEIGHENAEASWSFVRDGTVSWFHGIRYIPRPGVDVQIATNNGSDNVSFMSQVKLLCREMQPQMGFHPFMFRDGKCSLRQSWGDCWREECEDILKQEWGCGLRPRSYESDNDNTLLQPRRRDDCETPFHRVLHQVRHPLRTIESLVVKFCVGGIEGKVQPAFLLFANALFPQHNFSDMTCIEAAGYYADEYNSAMNRARESGVIDGKFQVEEATPCFIAKAAGFMDDSVLYSPSRDRVLKACNGEGDDTTANQLMTSTENRYNKGLISLSLDDLLGGRHGSRRKMNDDDLQKRIKKLTHSLGYSKIID